jgi:hypothetical protein
MTRLTNKLEVDLIGGVRSLSTFQAFSLLEYQFFIYHTSNRIV